MKLIKEIFNYHNSFLGIFIVLTISLYGVNHRYAHAGVLFLLFISLLMWRYPKPYYMAEVNELKKLTIYIFLAYPTSVLISLIIHNQWAIFYKELDNPLRFLLMIPIFLLLTKVKLDYRLIASAFSIGAIGIGLNAIFAFDGGRVALSYGNPISMGNVATALAVVSIAIVNSEHKFSLNIKLLSLAGLILGVSASLLSGSKGGWVSLAIVSIYGLYVWKISFSKKVSVVALTLLLLSLFDITMKNLPSSRLILFKQNIDCFIEDPRSECGLGSFGVRVWMILAGVYNFSNHPLAGSGLNTTVAMLNKAKQDDLIPNNVDSFNHLHNDFVEIISQMGIVGLSGYFIVFYGFIWVARKLQKLSNHRNPWSRVLFLNTILFFEFGMTQATLTHSSTITYFAFSNAILLGLAFRYLAEDTKN